MSYEIKLAQQDDYYQIARIYVNNYKTVYKDFVNIEYIRNLDHVKKSQEIKFMLNHTKYYVLKNDTRIVAYMNLEAGYRKKEITALYVDIDSHNKGYGTQLFNYVFELLEGYEEKLTGWVIKGYNPALNFYLKQGAILSGYEREDHKLGCKVCELILKLKN